MSKLLARQLIVVAAILALAAPALADSTQTNLPAGASADWWDQVQRTIRLEEYGVTSDGVAFRAANPAQSFEARFEADGVRIAPMDGERWEWGLTLRGWGRPGSLQPVGAAELDPNEDRIELDRGSLTEWFVNTPDGLEHGFTVPVRPRGAADDRLVFDLALEGGLRPVFAEDGQAIEFYSTGNISVLRYGKLVVIDAAGQELPARMEPIVGGVRLAVDDFGAVYPLTVDPLATTASWTAIGEATNNNFGYSVATAGDVNGDGYSDLLVGAYGNAANTGKTYLYLGSASGPSVAASWTATGETAGSRFGQSVATAGDVNGDGYSDVVVGAPDWSAVTGKAYVYLGSASGLSATASWTATGEAAGSRFGASVATAGDFNGDGRSDVVVGADGWSGTRGKAYVFVGGASGLSATASWTAEGEGSVDSFGASVAAAGDVDGDGFSDVLVGAYGHSTGSGKAYLYTGRASGLSATASWTATGAAALNAFGLCVATAGDVNGDGYSDVVIGEYGHNSATGKASVFLGGAGGLSGTASWTAVGEAQNSRFGWSVGTAGDVNGDGYSDLLVGAYGNNNFTGKAFMYLGGAAGLSATASWTTVGQSASSYFSGSVATAGDINGDGYSDVLVGSSGYSTSTGKAYAYRGGANGLSTAWSWTALGEGTNQVFGHAVAPAGDVNGDGYSDVIVGAYRALSYRGKTYLYLGGVNGLPAVASWTAAGEADWCQFGISVATAGDVDGDGYSDVVIGANAYSSSKGRAYVYRGVPGPVGLSETPWWTADGEASDSHFGFSVATAGDVNRDGYSDVVVGAYAWSTNRGKVYVYHGGAGTLSPTPSWYAEGEVPRGQFGRSVATAGDVNADGYSDLVVGSPDYDEDLANSLFVGAAYLYKGGVGGLSPTYWWKAVGENRDHWFGAVVATAGDVNGDGFSDVITGARGVSNGLGKAYLYHGSDTNPTGLPATPSWTAMGSGTNQFGQTVATAGDVNGDGFSDVLIGSGYSNLTGKAFLYLGSGSGLPATASWSKSGEIPTNTAFGYSLATAGDINGDGYADVVISDESFNYGAGKLYAYLGGSERGGVVILPRQMRADESAPVDLLGGAYEQQFRLGLTLHSPAGPGKRQLQWQVARLKTSLSSGVTPIQSDTIWENESVARSVPVSLAEDHTSYVWRARVRYHTAQSPFVRYSRWFTMTGDGTLETDVLSTSTPPPPPCAPGQEVYISTVALDLDGKPVLTIRDPNPTAQVTGYNVYRAATPQGPWIKVASNVADADPAPDIQYVDATGAAGAPWFYLVAAFNGTCGAEGP